MSEPFKTAAINFVKKDSVNLIFVGRHKWMALSRLTITNVRYFMSVYSTMHSRS